MQYQRAINIPVILASLMLPGCNVSNEAGDTQPQATTKYSGLVSGLCLASPESDSDIDKLIKRQVKRLQQFSQQASELGGLGQFMG